MTLPAYYPEFDFRPRRVGSAGQTLWGSFAGQFNFHFALAGQDCRPTIPSVEHPPSFGRDPVCLRPAKQDGSVPLKAGRHSPDGSRGASPPIVETAPFHPRGVETEPLIKVRTGKWTFSLCRSLVMPRRCELGPTYCHHCQDNGYG